jgi:hypothetical protein
MTNAPSVAEKRAIQGSACEIEFEEKLRITAVEESESDEPKQPLTD